MEQLNQVFKFSDDLQCGIVLINNKTIYVDIHDLFSIINHKRGFIHVDDTKSFPYYIQANRKISYFEFIYKYSENSVHCEYVNGNNYDIRRNNIEIYPKQHLYVKEKYQEIISYKIGHLIVSGKESNKVKNSTWKVKTNKGSIKIIMFCEKDTYIELCEHSYKKIMEFQEKHKKHITFSKHINGYIQSSANLFIHQIIMNCYGNGKGTSTISVDHIDRNPLNNFMNNLRIVKCEVQQSNSKGILKGTKRGRKHNARPLPDGITQDMLKKYVVYYRECYNKEKNLYREFFKIEKNPNLDKVWCTSKSGKLTLMDKLKQANDVAEHIEKHGSIEEMIVLPSGTPHLKLKMSLPKYVSYQTMRNKPYLVFEKRIQNMETNKKQRICLKHAMDESVVDNNDEKTIQEELSMLNDKVKEKYKIELLGC